MNIKETKSLARDFLEELTEEPLAILEDLPKPALTNLLVSLDQDIVDLALKGYTPEDMALRLALPTSTILATLKRKGIQDAISTSQESLDELRLAKLKTWYGDVLDARIEDAESAGESTRKDTLEVVKAYGDLLMAEKKNRKPEGEQNIYLNILNSVME